MTNEPAPSPNNNDNNLLTAGQALAAPAPPAVSRQRRWQLKMREQHRCWRCGEPAAGSLCLPHLAKERERQRRIRGYANRNYKARSYAAGVVAQPAPLDQSFEFSYEI